MKKLLLLSLAIILGSMVSACAGVYSKGQTAQYVQSLGYTNVRTHYIENNNLCGDARYYETVAWTANGASKGGIVCIRGDKLRPLLN